jgi:hypothetical protein
MSISCAKCGDEIILSAKIFALNGEPYHDACVTEEERIVERQRVLLELTEMVLIECSAMIEKTRELLRLY